ncbi:hypothetical protein FIBSPDRAFT_937859 [Athelia psychrophila]|uniref:DUF6533 domain-containing protein n=1 Tax=Athelia psychrophila TaxID=1759441 RepID=A0A165ZN57_9AGAM|nr:hypothetical protein FIBSPDRAFT_937859 [Fibularhizoctonia sp. CBS 109695]
MSLQHAVMTLSDAESLFSRNFTPYAITACGALLTYDILCTLDKEVEYVWNGPWSFGTILYVLNRYLPFIDTFISVKMLSGYNSPEVNFISALEVLVLTVVLGMPHRKYSVNITYAIWGRKRSILAGLIAIFIIVFVPAVVVTYLEISTLVYVPSQFAGQSGCFLDRAGAIIFVAYILLILCETWIKAVQHCMSPSRRSYYS